MSRVDLLDDFGEDTNHERKDLSFEIFDAKCLAVEDQGIEEIDGDFDDYRKEVLDELGEEILNPSLIANRAVEQ